MSTSLLSTTLALLYFISLLAYLFFALYQFSKTLLFLYFPYTRQPSQSTSPLLKLRLVQWKKFLSQISAPGSVKFSELDSDSHNELDVQRKKYSPTTFPEWTKCLLQRYHPFGILWYVLTAGREKPLPIAATMCLLVTAGCHWAVSVLYALIQYAGGLEFSVWAGIAVPCGAALLVITFGGMLWLRRILRYQVNSAMAPLQPKCDEKSNSQQTVKRKESAADLFLKNGFGSSKTDLADGSSFGPCNKPECEKLDPDTSFVLEPPKGETRVKLVLLIISIAASISMGFTISTCNTLSQTSVKNYLITFAISWALDLILLRPGFLLLLALIFSRQNNTVTDCNELQAFEYWRVPAEISLDDTTCCDLSKPPANSVLKDWKAGNILAGVSPINSIEDVKTEQSKPEFFVVEGFPKLENVENRLETVRDDAEGENMASVASPDGKRGRGDNKENGSVDGRAKMLWGFHDMFSSKQTSPIRSQRPEGKTLSPIKAEVSFVVAQKELPPILSPHKKLNPLVYCSPLKQTLKYLNEQQQSPPEHLVKTSPKRPKRTFFFDLDPDSASVKKYAAQKMTFEDPELKELVNTIKENTASIHAKSPPRNSPDVEIPSNTIFVQEKYVEPEQSPALKNASMVIMEEPEKLEENIESEASAGEKEVFFEKMPEKSLDPGMKQISLFGRQSAMSGDQQKLMLESMADMKLKVVGMQAEERTQVVSAMEEKYEEKKDGRKVKETVLDVSDFDATIEAFSDSSESRNQPPPLASIPTVEEEENTGRTITEGTGSQKSSARDRRTTILTQKARLKKWLHLAETHDKPMEAEKIRELLGKLKQTKKPLRKNELRDLEMLEALELPYGTRNNLPIQRPLSNEKYSSKSSSRSKSRGKPQDPGKLNELYMVYSSTRPKRLNSIDLKRRYGTQGSEGAEMKKELPPLKGVQKKAAESEVPADKGELANNKHLVKIDRIIGQCFDKVRKSFGKLKPRQSGKNMDEYGGDGMMELQQHEHKVRLPRRSLSKVDAHLFKLAN